MKLELTEGDYSLAYIAFKINIFSSIKFESHDPPPPTITILFQPSEKFCPQDWLVLAWEWDLVER